MVTRTEHLLLVSRSGAEVPIELNAAPVPGDSGDLRGAILVFRDIGKRRQFEEQSTHAKKMEAVGRLAGGVAGDFNDMLTVIAGYAEMLRGEVPAGSPREHVDEIVYAAERAATLTQQLLTFSRGGEAHPLVLDLNQMLSGMAPMLRRLLGHTSNCYCSPRLTGKNWPTLHRSNRQLSTWRPMRAMPCRTAASW